MENKLTKAEKAYFKRFALKNGIDKYARHLSLGIYLAVQDRDEEKIKEFSSKQSELYSVLGERYTKQVISINNSRYHRIKTVKRKIKQIVNSDKGLFLTLTFRDDVLESTSEKTRRTYVFRFCKKYGYGYVANQDFGKETNREHYHVVIFPKEELSKDIWEYGFMDIKPITCSSDDLVRVSKYVSKMTYHAVKDTASINRIIYSRNNPDFDKIIAKEVSRKHLADFMRDLELDELEQREANKSQEELVKELFPSSSSKGLKTAQNALS